MTFDEINTIIRTNALAAQKKYHWAIAPDEAIQVGWLAYLVREKNGIEVDCAKDLRSLIALRAWGAVADYVRKNTGRRTDKDGVFYTEHVYFESLDGMNESQLESIDMLTVDFESDNRDIVADAVAVARPRDRELLSLIYRDELKLLDIGPLYNVTSSRIHQKVRKILDYVRPKLNRRDYVL